MIKIWEGDLLSSIPYSNGQLFSFQFNKYITITWNRPKYYCGCKIKTFFEWREKYEN